MDIREIVKNFDFDGELLDVREFGSGHINRTFIAEYTDNRYVVQKINTTVFKNPDELMQNVFAVTDYLREVIEANGGDSERETLHFIKTLDGDNYFKTPDGECWRAYVFVKDSVCYDSADTPELFGKSGAAFGRFQKMLADFPAKTLHETIPNFHNTPWRFENEFLPSLFAADDALLTECEDDIEFVTSRRSDMEVFTVLQESGALPLRVTHNDTKLNNVMFDKKTGECVCVIDLDTVMPGLALYDFGDSIRFGASTAAEDESNLEKVSLDLDYFRAYAEGYLSEAGETLSYREKKQLAYSAKLITLECGMRFLTDYLNGNIYFKTDYGKQNLVRARNQFKLVLDIESKLDEMNKIVMSIK
ncbi:MAG: aminoglycoside phosphotransferase family protein [Eubacterium sp.]|nr:aminoglycoside phosphotransferase family protein [Eubacterium sp.]MBR7073081.1 aminoglycoside phosphotransferase family protein [Eubacterium sp.]